MPLDLDAIERANDPTRIVAIDGAIVAELCACVREGFRLNAEAASIMLRMIEISASDRAVVALVNALIDEEIAEDKWNERRQIVDLLIALGCPKHDPHGDSDGTCARCNALDFLEGA